MEALKLIEQKKAAIVLMVPTICLFVIFKYFFIISTANEMVFSVTNASMKYPSSYLVYSEKCKIPNVDPFNKEVKRLYKKEKFVQCSKVDPLTTVTKNKDSTVAYVHINKKLIPSYVKEGGVTCCVGSVSRHAKGGSSIDNHIVVSKCTDFIDNTTLPDKPVIVRCRNSKTQREVFSNTYAPVIVRKNVQAKINKWDSASDKISKPLSVLFVGLDSVSRLNMMRIMPETRRYLDDNGWLEIQGYNKIGDNTYPNLMAILTGRNYTSIYSDCDPTKTGKLDACNFLWYAFRDKGYVTGYAEGHGDMSTFNYCKVGFQREPADYYFRPYAMASEMLKTTDLDELMYCVGPLSYGERILKVAEDFSTTFKDVPNFGLYWLNYAHNKLNSGSRFDYKLKNFFENLSDKGVLDNSVVIFLSDHGLRFGKILYTYTGWLEERLPFFYIWMPKWFREMYPVEYEYMRNNANKLTTPYDLYMTIQDILVYSGRNYTRQPSTGCKNSKSLFEEIPAERSCKESCIDLHWCTCTNFEYVSEKNTTVQDAAHSVVTHIQGIISERKEKEAKKCAKYKLKKVVSSRWSIGSPDTHILVILETVPSAVFESTVRVNFTATGADRFKVETGISRLDSYKSHSGCVSNSYLKTLCHCKK